MTQTEAMDIQNHKKMLKPKHPQMFFVYLRDVYVEIKIGPS